MFIFTQNEIIYPIIQIKNNEMPSRKFKIQYYIKFVLLRPCFSGDQINFA